MIALFFLLISCFSTPQYYNIYVTSLCDYNWHEYYVPVRSLGSVAYRMSHHRSLTTQFDFYSVDFNEVSRH